MGRADHAVRCVVVDSNWKRVRVETDLAAAPWVAMGALSSELSMMPVAEAPKGQLDATTNLEGAIVRAKR